MTERRINLSIGDRRSLMGVAMLCGMTWAGACTSREILVGEPADARVSQPVNEIAGNAAVSVAPSNVAGSASNAATVLVGRAGAGDGAAGYSGAQASVPMLAHGGGGGAVASSDALSEPSRPSSGCGRDPGVPVGVVEVIGQRANYVLDLPAAYDKAHAYRLVMAFRDPRVTVDAFRAALMLPSDASTDAIVVYPSCLDDTASSWDVQRDIGVYEVLLAQLAQHYCVDEARVFAVGHGSGALFVNALGCIHSDNIRGIALLSSALRPAGACSGQTAVWVLQSTAEAAALDAARVNRDFWARQSACDLTRSIAVDPSPCLQYLGCDMRYPVRYCEYDGADTLPSFAGAGAWVFLSGM